MAARAITNEETEIVNTRHAVALHTTAEPPMKASGAAASTQLAEKLLSGLMLRRYAIIK
jgi:hypothetical protein